MAISIRFLLFFFLILTLYSCRLINAEERVYIYAPNYKYKSMDSENPKEIADAVAKNSESKILLVACPTSTPSMIRALQQLLSIKSNIRIHLVYDDCV